MPINETVPAVAEYNLPVYYQLAFIGYFSS
jgi:hypothetical protein